MKTSIKTLLEVKNLSVSIKSGGRQLSAVEDVSFEVREGEILGLVGESGSGKSLTALSIAGLLSEGKTASGSILCGNEDLLTLSEDQLLRIRGKVISMIFQEPFSSLNPLMRIGNQIAETLTLHGETDKTLVHEKVITLMKQLKFDEAEKTAAAFPFQLSGGMCQRAMIALALICGPRLLIADEPTTALDSATQVQILNLLKEINAQMGTSILFISHDLSLVKNFCDRVIVMYCGRILEEGSSQDVFSRPDHEYTRGLFASIPLSANRGKPLAAIPGKVPSLEEGRPSGCPFHPRCKNAKDSCRIKFPAPRSVNDDHVSRCITREDRNG